MSKQIDIRKEGCVGRITLTRPEVLNALSHEMCLAISAALSDWAADDTVAMVLLDAQGDKAFCAGGDLQEMYATGCAGDYDYGRSFWRDEYRMNADVFNFPKPVVSFMQGYTMGGGVGVGCHASHRILCETSLLSLPEVAVGLVPDVGSTLILGRAPGRLGEFLGVTAQRMAPGDAIYAGFADYVVPEGDWAALKAELIATGDWEAVDRAAAPAPPSPLAALQPQIDRNFSGETLRDILIDLAHSQSDLAPEWRARIDRHSPLAMAATVELVHRARMRQRIEEVLELEYRYTSRAMERGDFLEGIRAAIIDRSTPARWRHDDATGPSVADVAGMLLPLGAQALKL